MTSRSKVSHLVKNAWTYIFPQNIFCTISFLRDVTRNVHIPLFPDRFRMLRVADRTCLLVKKMNFFISSRIITCLCNLKRQLIDDSRSCWFITRHLTRVYISCDFLETGQLEIFESIARINHSQSKEKFFFFCFNSSSIPTDSSLHLESLV